MMLTSDGERTVREGRSDTVLAIRGLLTLDSGTMRIGPPDTVPSLLQLLRISAPGPSHIFATLRGAASIIVTRTLLTLRMPAGTFPNVSDEQLLMCRSAQSRRELFLCRYQSDTWPVEPWP
jgi:hypothetical protein